MAAKEKTVTQMVDEIAKARGVKRDEAHDYMIRVAHGRLLALATWRKSVDKGSKVKSKSEAKPKSKAKIKAKSKAPKVVKVEEAPVAIAS